MNITRPEVISNVCKVKYQISIVIPLYNEEEILPYLIERIKGVINSSKLDIEVILVDDGSTDNTPERLKQISLLTPHFNVVFLARNYGHQIALSAGLNEARATDAVFIIDGDLQDPPELLEKFYLELKEGNDVVYGIRANRKENFLKKLAYRYFYRLQKSVVKIDIPLDSGDFSLLSRRVVDLLKSMPEESRYVRGLRAWIGLKQLGIEYDRDKRIIGTSKYSLKKLLALALNGIFNFTELPVKLITKLGIFTFIGACIYLAVTLYKRFILNDVPDGFTGLLFTIVLFSGVQLISIGVIGEYIIRIFFQTKNRPLYIVKEKIMDQQINEKGIL